MTRQFYKRLAPCCLVAVIVGSFLPWTVKNNLGTPADFSTAKTRGVVQPWHRAVHVLSFGFTAAVLILASKNMNGRVLGLFTVVLLSSTIEYVQNLLDHFGVEWWDVRDDTLSACAVFLLLLWPPLRRRMVGD